ncbi:hypothetical protein CFHF_19940 [Caulobacter flavus]|uniref:Uncharacterized protein n=1 Tax=Caulobacter flavus TaxID=1679497 RepID=A0A2N5CP37_9CAUL|nr:hypothetical protein [Caulobacter flavus]AYV48560.1 hypothetical protein C1707_21125 [Caulobacter flavus]PLR08723.1 hypothetical protein CFHF_19940 [Caulobacter flavus]
MDQTALMEDMRRATESIVAARLPIRLRAAQKGVVVEAPACATTRLVDPLEATVTWAALDQARAAVLHPLVGALIAFLHNGGPPPPGFERPQRAPVSRRLH